MKKSRLSVFETNSSSTHSFSILKRNGGEGKIPHNIKDLKVGKEVELIYNNVAITEMEKLRYVMAIIASYLSYFEDSPAFEEDGVLSERELEKRKTFFPTVPNEKFARLKVRDEVGYCLWKLPSDDVFGMMKDKILGFLWVDILNELIWEKCRTTIDYERTSEDFPYISEVISAECNILDELEITEENAKDRKFMKEFFENIIFNPSVIISDKEEEW